MQLKPVAKNVVIQLVTPEKKTASGIFLQEEQQKNIMTGKIIDVGPEAKQAKVGLMAHVSKYAVGDVKPTDGDLVIVDEYDILLMTE